MKTQKISISFTTYTDANLLTKSEFILQSMTNNPAFANPVPPLTDLQTAVNDYSTALTNAATLDRNAVSIKNDKRAALEAILKQLGMYVMYVANGDVTILVSSGFSLTKLPAPSHLDTPGYPDLVNGSSSGQLLSSSPRITGAVCYLHEITAEPLSDSSVWQSTPKSKSNNTFTGLEAGKKYWVRMAAVGTSDQVTYGPAASLYIL